MRTALLGLLALLLAHPSQASLCGEAGLKTFKIREVPRFAFVDYCARPDGEVPPQVASAISQLGSVHRRVADYFGLTREQLLGKEGVKVLLRGVAAGALDSYFGLENVIGLGVFPDWDGQPLNESIYIHELGHLLAAVPNPHLPPILVALSEQALMVETFADFVTVGVTGKLFAPSFDVPACFWKVRSITENQSYKAPKQFFETTYSKASVLSCCRHLKARGLHDDHTRGLCAKAPISFPELSGLPFKLDRKKLFKPEDYLSGNGFFDAHRIGIPFNSFLRSLEKREGMDVRRLFIAALAKASLDPPAKVVCGLEAIPELATVESTIASPGDVLARFVESVPPKHRAGFEALWKKHRMDIFKVMAEGEPLKQASSRSLRALDRKVQELVDGRDPAFLASQCWEPVFKSRRYTPECTRVSCREIPH